MFEAVEKSTLHRIPRFNDSKNNRRLSQLAINYCDLMALELVNQLAGWRQ